MFSQTLKTMDSCKDPLIVHWRKNCKLVNHDTEAKELRKQPQQGPTFLPPKINTISLENIINIMITDHIICE